MPVVAHNADWYGNCYSKRTSRPAAEELGGYLRGMSGPFHHSTSATAMPMTNTRATSSNIEFLGETARPRAFARGLVGRQGG
jgi:hypothetical protein